MPVLQKAIASSLNESASITMLTLKPNETIMDLDTATVTVEVAEAIALLTRPGCVTTEDIKLRKFYSGMQDRKTKDWMGKLSSSTFCNTKLCFEIRHIAKHCKSSIDRSAQ